MADPDNTLLIVDTDPGVDDAMALLYLDACSDVKLLALTTVFGNADVETTTRNACYIVDEFNLDIPVYQGAAKPLKTERFESELKVHGEDGLGDTGLAHSQATAKPDRPAHLHMIDMIHANPHQVTLLAIGPLTNLALALQEAPEIAGLVKQVVVMGGAFGTSGRNGNITPYAEANFYYDPDAADAVFQAGWPITAVGLDVTSDCIMSASQARKLAITGGGAGAFFLAISRGYEEIYRTHDNIDGFVIHDVAAAAFVANRSLFSITSGAVKICTEGPGRGSSSQNTNDSSRGNSLTCSTVDSTKLVTNFIDAIEKNFGEGVSRKVSIA